MSSRVKIPSCFLSNSEGATAIMAYQKYIPILELESHRVMGLLDLGSNVEFTGEEISHTLLSGISVTIMKYVPQSRVDPRAKVNPWYMAAPFSRSDVRANAHKGYPEFIEIQDAKPAQTMSATSGIGYQTSIYNGPFVDGIEGNFAAGRQQHDPV